MDWKWLVAAIGGILAWLWSVFVWFRSQKQQRAQDEYTRKEKLYRELLVTLEAFYKGPAATGATPFLQQVRLAWLYAPDDVVKKLYAFLDTQKAEIPADQRDLGGRKTLADVVAAIRRDLFTTLNKNSELTSDDFRHFT